MVYEFLEWKVLPDYRSEWFKNKPKWLPYIMSGDSQWDWRDIFLNLMGSSIIIGIYNLTIELAIAFKNWLNEK